MLRTAFVFGIGKTHSEKVLDGRVNCRFPRVHVDVVVSVGEPSILDEIFKVAV